MPTATQELTLTLSLTRTFVEGNECWDGQITEGLEEPIYSIGSSAAEAKQAIIDILKARGLKGVLNVTYPQAVRTDGATEKQISFALNLYKRKSDPGADLARLEAQRKYFQNMSKRTISEYIDKAMKLPDLKVALKEATAKTLAPVKEPRVSVQSLAEGIYTIGNDIYKVIVAVNGSGMKYAKKLNKGGGFAKAPKGSMTLIAQEGVKLTAEKAKEFGALYGTCCCCGRDLTDEQSIADGIGPICKAKYL